MFPEIPGGYIFRTYGNVRRDRAEKCENSNFAEYKITTLSGDCWCFWYGWIKQILFCHKKHKFQEKNAGAKLVLVSVFLVRSNTVRVGVDDLIKQNGCLCCCVVILWKFTGKGEGVVPQGKEKFPFQRIIRLKRNKFERKQEGVVVDIPGCRSHQMKLPGATK